MKWITVMWNDLIILKNFKCNKMEKRTFTSLNLLLTNEKESKINLVSAS